MESNIESSFERACDYVNRRHSKLDSNSLVRLYGYFKQATVGKCKTPKPSIFNFQSQLMWKAWFKLNDMSKSEAMQNYVHCLTSAVENWEDEIDEESNEPKENSWIAVSSLCKEADLPETSKGFYDWVKEGNLEKLKELGSFSANLRDDHGLTLLHWAADRGHSDIAEYLIKEKNVDVNCRDEDDQSPLHYAAACGHFNVCKLLIDSGADVLAKDRDQLTPKDAAEVPDVVRLLCEASNES